MTKRSTFLLLFALLLPASSIFAAEAPNGIASDSIRLTAPTEDRDGNTLTDLDSMRLYWGFATRDYVDSVVIANATEGAIVQQSVTITLTGSPGDTVGVFYTSTATDDSGNESVFGNEIRRDFLIVDNIPPGPPSIEFTVPVAYIVTDKDDGRLLALVPID